MATKKSGGSSKNLRDSQPKYLGTKLYDGQTAQAGSIIVRQRGTKILPGSNVKVGRDHTIFSLINGLVRFTERRKTGFNGQSARRKVVSVVPQNS